MNTVRFTKDDRSSFPYWFAHWCAFNMTALNLKVWRPKYLLHDIEKPWLRIFMSYKKVQKLHNKHRKHHLLHYFITGKADWREMIIDWECCRFTKQMCPLDAVEEFKRVFKQFEDFFMEGIVTDSKCINYFISNKDIDIALMEERCKIAYINLKNELEKVFNIDLSDYFNVDFLNKDE